MAATDLKNLRIRLSIDEAGNVIADLSAVAKGLDDLDRKAKRAGGGFSKLGADIVTTNQALDLARKTYALLATAVGAAVDFGQKPSAHRTSSRTRASN